MPPRAEKGVQPRPALLARASIPLAPGKRLVSLRQHPQPGLILCEYEDVPMTLRERPGRSPELLMWTADGPRDPRPFCDYGRLLTNGARRIDRAEFDELRRLMAA